MRIGRKKYTFPCTIEQILEEPTWKVVIILDDSPFLSFSPAMSRSDSVKRKPSLMLTVKSISKPSVTGLAFACHSHHKN